MGDMKPKNRVIYTDPGGRGWATVELMAKLLAEHLEAEFVSLSTRPRVDRVRRATGALPARRASRGTCIVVAPQPAHLGSLLTPHYLLRGYERVVGWVVDSFLEDRIPRMARGSSHYDELFITDAELTGVWQQITGTPTQWLPFGSDVLDQPDLPPARETDLLRVGRQPPAWGDDEVTAQDAARLGVVFSPGPAILRDPVANQAALMAAMRGAKFTLSFTNLVSPAAYTHPTRDYVTGRWTDALASGAAVAGVPPRCEAGERLLWDEGLLIVPADDREAGIERVRDASRAWRPELAWSIQARALQTLDWRLRFHELAQRLDLTSPRLDDELARLAERADRLGTRFG